MNIAELLEDAARLSDRAAATTREIETEPKRDAKAFKIALAGELLLRAHSQLLAATRLLVAE